MNSQVIISQKEIFFVNWKLHFFQVCRKTSFEVIFCKHKYNFSASNQRTSWQNPFENHFKNYSIQVYECFCLHAFYRIIFIKILVCTKSRRELKCYMSNDLWPEISNLMKNMYAVISIMPVAYMNFIIFKEFFVLVNLANANSY